MGRLDVEQGHETVLSLLCCREWQWAGELWDFVKFLPDGTGELQLAGQTTIFVAYVFHWRALDASILAQPAAVALPARFELEITLTRDVISYWQQHATSLRADRCLNEIAFEPRTIAFTLEKGCFGPEWERVPFFSFERQQYFYGRFGLRLCFEESPYPPIDAWHEVPGPGSCRQTWKWHYLVSERLPHRFEDDVPLLHYFGPWVRERWRDVLFVVLAVVAFCLLLVWYHAVG
ncbi:uncharacterized protein K452DRAFT_322709 [Aplosporella prunicola CBS 121167]|uniref:Uncharacterized protein n=1 Tax=Aplosporella prunicola CBS 121167 TaxID=1176127 RepID=A0A6A6AYZ6_9PEZI|nr:uncharacterized protein K452DRAFT_322709 [Aplosporella prunicola CBS 121167]KAF2135997.1 hypothetical protein K452DRAFT_322709 [Aplosporella prunicola CBS 121167]